MITMLAPISMTQLSLSGPQSVTDYPLRNHTMLVMAAIALAVLARIAADPQEQG